MDNSKHEAEKDQISERRIAEDRRVAEDNIMLDADRRGYIERRRKAESILVKKTGVKIYYEFSGKMDAPVVMLSHSLGFSSAMWEPQIDLLARHFQVLCVDTRGHGQSEAPPGAYTIEQLGEDTLGLLDTLGIEAVHFVGLSMGGIIGQYLALNRPERLLSLVLCDTLAFFPEEMHPVWQERVGVAREQGMRPFAQETMERWFTPAFFSQNPQAVERIRSQFLATPVEGYLSCSAAIRELDYLNRLSEIKTPTLIIVGEDDPATPVAVSEAIHQRIDGSKLVVLPSAAHLSNIEQTEAFNKALLEFLLNKS
ncbi:3-oxoadipate enol-lactonase [Thermodesulfobacteriota bacterium]